MIIPSGRNIGVPAITQPDLVVEAELSGGQVTFEQCADKMYRHDLRPEPGYFGPAYGRLQPGAMMKTRVPVPNRCVIATSRQFVTVREIVPDDEAFNAEIVIALFGRCAELAENTERVAERCSNVHGDLADSKAILVAAVLRYLTDIAEAHEEKLGAVLIVAALDDLRMLPVCRGDEESHKQSGQTYMSYRPIHYY